MAGRAASSAGIDDLPDEPLPVDPPKPLWERMSIGTSDSRSRLKSSNRSCIRCRAPWTWSDIASFTAVQFIARAHCSLPKSAPPSPRKWSSLRRTIASSSRRSQAVDRVLGAGVPQIAVFDTGFHATLEPRRLRLPRSLTNGSSKGFAATDSTGSAINTPPPRGGDARRQIPNRCG